MTTAEERANAVDQLGTRVDVKISDLRLDEENPRFPENQSGNKQLRIAQVILYLMTFRESPPSYGFFC